MESPLVSIVILNYNGERWIRNCLESLAGTGYDNFRILFVDNNSGDGSVELARRLSPNIELILNPANYGFSTGNNLGIRRALENGSDYIVLLNPDTRVEADWLAHLIETGESDPRIGILGAAQLNYDDHEYNSWTTTALSRHLEEIRTHEKARQWIPVEWVEGSCFAVKRRVFEEIGLLDPIYFAFYEEIDFCRRALCHGYEVALVPRSLVHHYRGGIWQANRERRRERAYRCDRSQFIYNLTDPRRTILENLYWYLVTLGTKCKELMGDFSAARARDLLQMQFDVIGDLGKLFGKWRRERSALRKGLTA